MLALMATHIPRHRYMLEIYFDYKSGISGQKQELVAPTNVVAVKYIVLGVPPLHPSIDHMAASSPATWWIV